MLRSLLREGSRFPATVEVSMLVVALSAMAGLATAQDDETGPRLDGLKRLDLPQEIARASDVRWLADGEIVLGVIGSGIHAWRLGEKGAELRVALEDPAPEVLEIGGRAVVNRNTFERDYGLLGSSPQGLAFADLFGGVFLANDSGIDGPVDIKFLGDLDRRGALTAAVGLMLRDADGWAPYAAWLIADGGGSPRGLLPTRDGGRGLELCRDAELSVIRFISEDRLLVIPGAEAGIFVYDVDGSIHDSLDAATFFAETGCDVEPNEWGNSPLNDAYARADWLSPRRVIDEVVAPHCYEPATPGWAPATGAYHWRPAPRWRAEGSRRRPSIHHVALRSSQRAVGFNRQRPVSVGPGRQRAQEPAVQPRGRAGVPGGSVRDLVVAAVPPPSGRVCWDLVHARVGDLRTVARQPCVVESEFADTRLRADLRGDRVVILLRGGALRGADVRAAEAFEARLLPPAGSGD